VAAAVVLVSMATMALAVAAVLAVFFLARQHKLRVLFPQRLAVAVAVLQPVAVMAAMVATPLFSA
jgi:hypothetical protein